MMKTRTARGLGVMTTLAAAAGIGLATAAPASASVHCALKDITTNSVRFQCSGSTYSSAVRLYWTCGSTNNTYLWSISSGYGSKTFTCGTTRITNMRYQSLS